MQNSFDTSSRLTSLKVDSTEVAGNIAYNAADQTTSIKVGPSGTNQVTENYAFDAQTGLLTGQTAANGGGTILNLSYDYNRNNSNGSRDRGRQQYLWDEKQAGRNSNPVARPGTSNHEAGFAFDIPSQFRSPSLAAILRKWNFVKLPSGKDKPHWAWKNAPKGAAAVALNAKMNAWFKKCVRNE